MRQLDSKQLKLHNTRLVLNTMRNLYQGKKQDVVNATGLSMASCTTILNELVASEQIIELELATPKGGRPARQFKYNKEYSHILLLSITKEDKDEIVHLYVCNLLGDIKSKTIIHKPVSSELIMESIENQIGKYPTISFISIGLPGIIHNGVILSCDIQSLTNLELQNTIEQQFKIPISIENDVNAIASGYYFDKDYAIEPESIVYIYYPTNGDPGAGIIVNGKIIRGINNIAGEIKHMDANNNRKLSQRILKSIENFIYTLNPNYFIISGNDVTKKDQQFIQDKLVGIKQSTKVLFENDIHEHYLLGLKHKAFEILMEE